MSENASTNDSDDWGDRTSSVPVPQPISVETETDAEPETGEGIAQKRPSSIPKPAPGDADHAQVKSPVSPGISRAAVKRSIEKFSELDSAGDGDLRAAALVLGVKPNALDATVAVMSAPRAPVRLLTLLESIADAGDPFAAMAAAMSLELAELKRIVELLRETGVSIPRAPSGPAALATVVAKAVLDNAETVRASSARLRDLVRR